MHARLTLGRSWVQFPSRPRLPKQETADKMATGAERMKLKQVREKVGRLGLDGNRTKGLQSFETSTHPQCHNSSTVPADQRWTQQMRCGLHLTNVRWKILRESTLYTRRFTVFPRGNHARGNRAFLCRVLLSNGRGRCLDGVQAAAAV